MLKKERLVRITQMVNQKGIISINEIMEQLEISDMTARRDLDELEKSGKLLRVHGGAQSLSFSMDHERSHLEKSSVQIEEKTRIAHKAKKSYSRRRNYILRSWYYYSVIS